MGSLDDLPAPPPSNCPGTGGEEAGKASACAGCPNQSVCASGKAAPVSQDPDIPLITERLQGVKHKILVLSGKGGVGKSTFSAQLAFGLCSRSKEVISSYTPSSVLRLSNLEHLSECVPSLAHCSQVGLLDIDICGPSVPKMMALEGEEIHQSNSGWSPVYVEDNLGVMSIGFMLPDQDDPVIWRGPRKNGRAGPHVD